MMAAASMFTRKRASEYAQRPLTQDAPREHFRLRPNSVVTSTVRDIMAPSANLDDLSVLQAASDEPQSTVTHMRAHRPCVEYTHHMTHVVSSPIDSPILNR